MTTDEFFTKYNYKPIDYDGAHGFQCVDLYRQYVKEVLGFPQSPPVSGAADIWTTYDPRYYDKLFNTPLAIPKKGDILIWDRRAGGGYGHVAIYKDGGLFSFTSFDQNWPVGSYCHFQGHNYYGGLIGWLRPKQVPVGQYTDRQALLDIRGVVSSNVDDSTARQKVKDILVKIGV